MSKYSISIRNIINMLGRETVESWFKNYELTDYLTANQIQKITENGVWNKDKLAKKIVDHYFMHEIGFETIELFKHYAKVTMQEIMEEKLPIIYSNALEYNPLVNVDFTETFERDISGTGTYNSNSSLESSIENENNSSNTTTSQGSNSGTATSQGSASSNSSSHNETLDIENRTPQTNITKQNLNSGIYASNVKQGDATSSVQDSTTSSNTNTTSGTESQTVNSQGTTSDSQSSNSSQNAESEQNTETTESYTRTQKGNSGSLTTAQALVMQYRKAIYAVDKEIIEELNCLFMGLF